MGRKRKERGWEKEIAKGRGWRERKSGWVGEREQGGEKEEGDGNTERWWEKEIAKGRGWKENKSGWVGDRGKGERRKKGMETQSDGGRKRDQWGKRKEGCRNGKGESIINGTLNAKINRLYMYQSKIVHYVIVYPYIIIPGNRKFYHLLRILVGTQFYVMPGSWKQRVRGWKMGVEKREGYD